MSATEGSIFKRIARFERLMLVLLVLLGLGFYAANAAHYVGQPLRIEESEWPPMGKATFEHGKPEISQGENHRIRFNADGSLENATYSGLWHPPLYMYSMAAFMAVAGADATTSLRLIGAIGMLACCGFMLLLAREVASGRNVLRLGAISVFLLLIHPYAIQGSLFLDIDTSILPAAFLFFLWVVARYERLRDYSTRSAVLVGMALAVVLWCKLTTVLVLVPILPLFWMARAGVLRGLKRALLVMFTGAATFFLTYWIYIQITGQDFWYTFDFTFGKTAGLVVWEQAGSALMFSLRLQIAWFIPALLILGAVYGVMAAPRWIRTKQVTTIDLVWIVGAAIVLFYSVVVPNGSIYEAKYALSALPLIIFAVTAMLLRVDRQDEPEADVAPARKWNWVAAVITAGVMIVLVVLMPDLISGQAYAGITGLALVLIVAGSGAAILLAAFSSGARMFAPAGVIAVLATLFLIQDFHSWRANTSPLFGGRDTSDFIRSGEVINDELRPGETAIVSKDLGIRIKNRIIEGEDIWLVRSDPFEAQIVRDSPWITVVGTNEFGPPIGGEMLDVLNDCFEEQKVGRASVYVRKDRCGRAPLVAAP